VEVVEAVAASVWGLGSRHHTPKACSMRPAQDDDLPTLESFSIQPERITETFNSSYPRGKNE